MASREKVQPRPVPYVGIDGRHPVAGATQEHVRTETGVAAAHRESRIFMRRYAFRAMVLDACALATATAVASVLHYEGPTLRLYAALTVVLTPIWVAVVAAQRGYEHRYLGTGPEEYRRVLNAGLIFVASLAVAAFAAKYELSRLYVLVAVPLTVALALVGRHLLRRAMYRLRRKGQGAQRVLVVGRADAAVATVDQLHREPEHGLVSVGLCVPRADVQLSHLHEVPVVGTLDDVMSAVDEVQADVVAVVSHPDLSGAALRRLSWALEARDVDLVVSPGIIEVAGPRLSIRPVAGLSLLHLERPPTSGGRLLMKAALDRLAGLFLLCAASPLLLVAALAVKLNSPGPALFRQTRVGIDGQPFTMFKLRSMVVNAHALRIELEGQNESEGGMLFKMKSDPRITRVGAILRRYSIDELPQLLNVVRGEMSLVGPRPPLPEEVAKYTPDAARRLRVRPGLTGLWQVSGRSDLSWEESLRLDLRYVDNWSWPLDLSILWRTSKAVFGRSGAY